MLSSISRVFWFLSLRGREGFTQIERSLAAQKKSSFWEQTEDLPRVFLATTANFFTISYVFAAAQILQPRQFYHRGDVVNALATTHPGEVSLGQPLDATRC